jgi:hypothetical protein
MICETERALEEIPLVGQLRRAGNDRLMARIWATRGVWWSEREPRARINQIKENKWAAPFDYPNRRHLRRIISVTIGLVQMLYGLPASVASGRDWVRLGVLGCVLTADISEASGAGRLVRSLFSYILLLSMMGRGRFPLAWLLACEHEDGAVSPGRLFAKPGSVQSLSLQ